MHDPQIGGRRGIRGSTTQVGCSGHEIWAKVGQWEGVDTPSCTSHQGLWDMIGSPMTKDTVAENTLAGKQFVLSRTWTKLGGGQELALGIDKDKLKALIEKIGRQCYLGILGTDQCVSSSSGRHPQAKHMRRCLRLPITISSTASFMEYSPSTIHPRQFSPLWQREIYKISTNL